MTRTAKILAAFGFLLTAVAPAVTAAQGAGNASRVIACPIAQKWIKDKGEYQGPKVASITMQRLESTWFVDSTRASRELTTFLVQHPELLGRYTAGGKACPERGCVCPRPPDLAQAGKLARVETLDASYRADDEGAAAGIGVFLAAHQRLLFRVSDSLQHFGTSDQLKDFRKSFAETQKSLTSAKAAVVRQP